jgi:hypothetical protein
MILIGGVVCFSATAIPAETPYRYTIVDSLRSEVDYAFWEPWIGPPGNGGASETGYYISAPGGLELGSFHAYLGMSNWLPTTWTLSGDFRVSFFLETSPYLGSYGNRLGAGIYETTPACDALVPADGYGGLWMGYSGPPASTYGPLAYSDAAFFLFVKTGNSLTIYKGDISGVSESDQEVFVGNYFNPEGQFLFYFGTGGPNAGWLRARDVEIQTEDLIACDGVTPIPDDWAASDDADGDADGDGVANAADACPGTPAGAMVNALGCSMAQTAPCDGNWKNHGAYVSAVVKAAQTLRDDGLIGPSEMGSIVRAAASSTCGQK